MRGAALALLLALAVVAAAARQTPDMKSFLRAGKEEEGELWALLIAGSAGWGNYRHQADVAHAYQVLRRGGLKDDRIIIMAYGDIAHNEENPHPGKLFNSPGGPDVFDGVTLDYSGDTVTAANFLAVLAGDEKKVEVGKHASGRVVSSGANDRVFVYYSDHGAPGILGIPSGPFLYADQLHEVLRSKSRHGGFKEMVMYVEACESGSMFEGMLEEDLGVYITTASNGHESSWGCYCPGMNPAPPAEFSTCLGDLYSVSWLEDSDREDLTAETLKKQFQVVKQRTSQNFTYVQGSHVMRFGELEIDQEPAAEYLGELNTGDRLMGAAPREWSTLEAVPQRDADLLHLYTKYQRAEPGEAKSAALRVLNVEVSKRAALEAGLRSATAQLLEGGAGLGPLLQARYGGWLAAANGQGIEGLASLLVTSALPRDPGAPVVDDWDCLRGMVAAWEGSCGPLDQYGMKATKLLINLCNAGLAPAALGSSAGASCQPVAAAA